jgi:hypothetical protein
MAFCNSRWINATRKDHKCFGCRKIIPKGSRAELTFGADEVGFFRYYMCVECVEYAESNDDYIDSNGDFREGAIADIKQSRVSNG